MEIDELGRDELAEAVGVSQGWTRYNGYWLDRDGMFEIYTEDYDPSRNIAQAWDLVEVARADGWFISVAPHIDGYQSILTRHISHQRFNRDQFEFWADTAPVAICRAFLKADDLMRRCISFRRPV
jgi:hypothetical protein